MWDHLQRTELWSWLCHTFTASKLPSFWELCIKPEQRENSECARDQSCSLPSTLLFSLAAILSTLQDQALSYELSSHYRLSLFGI